MLVRSATTAALLIASICAWPLVSSANEDIDELDEKTLKSISEFANANGIKPPNQLNYGPADVEKFAKAAKAAHKDIGAVIGAGDKNTTYDVIIQIGHYPKTSGSTGGEGRKHAFLNNRRVSEQDVAALVGINLHRNLKNAGINVLVVESRPEQFGGYQKSRIFLALHTDSSSIPCNVGPSVGYDDKGDAQGMHLIAFALATALDRDPVKFMRDNYTKNLQRYYSYKYFEADLFEGLLEMGELTCPKQEDDMLVHADAIAKNLALGIRFALKPTQLPWQ